MEAALHFIQRLAIHVLLSLATAAVEQVELEQQVILLLLKDHLLP